MQSRVAGTLGVILVRDRRAEEGHDAVAGELVHRAIEAVHALGEDLKQAIEDSMPFLWAELLSEFHRSLHVCKQDRHVLALAFQRGPGSENLLGEVLWCVITGRALGHRRSRFV
jgi:hypothetical protein